MSEKCGYLRKDDTCNYSGFCKNATCVAILDNLERMERKTLYELEDILKTLQELKEFRTCGGFVLTKAESALQGVCQNITL